MLDKILPGFQFPNVGDSAILLNIIILGVTDRSWQDLRTLSNFRK